MKRVLVSVFRSHLSRYLKEARRGDEILIIDRQNPVAKLVRPSPAETGEREAEMLTRLADNGVVAPPRAPLRADFFTDMPRSRKSVVQALLDEREEAP